MSSPIAPSIRRTGRNKKQSSASSVVAQALAKKEHTNNIQPLEQTRVEQGLNTKTGFATLTAIFPKKGGGVPQKLNLSYLLEFPKLQPIFTEAFLQWGISKEPTSRKGYAAQLNNGLFAYLKASYPPSITPHELDDELLLGFRDNLLHAKKSTPLSPRTANCYLSAVRAILESLDHGPWASEAQRIAERVPSGPTGSHHWREPIEVLDIPTLLAIMQAAENEVIAIEKRWQHGRQLIADGRKNLASSNRTLTNTRADYKDLATCLAALDAANKTVIPAISVIESHSPALAQAIRKIHRMETVSGFFHPSSRDMVPFVVLLTISTVFNPDTVLALSWSSIRFDKDRAGTPAIEIVGLKERASKNLVRLLDPEASVSSTISLKGLLSCLKEITARLRAATNTEHADRLFLFCKSRKKDRCGRSFGSLGNSHFTPSGDGNWQRNLELFTQDNKLPHFTLGQLRPTIIDMVQFLDGSLETAQKVGNHGSPITTWRHYTSSGVKKRYRERLGQVIMLRERWLDSNGDIDPRRLTPDQDKGAATPGFICLDPFDSPRSNQKREKLCTDYGGCPACPLSGARPNDPSSVAYYTALERAIFASQFTMSANTWLQRWAPVLADLSALLKIVPSSILEASRKYRINLPNVG